MRTALRIDDDLLAELKERAAKEKISLAELVNSLLRSGLRERFHEKPVAMGEAKVDLTKALRLSDSFGDDEFESNQSRRK